MFNKKDFTKYDGSLDGVYMGWTVLVATDEEQKNVGLLIKASGIGDSNLVELTAHIVDLEKKEIIENLDGEYSYFDSSYGNIDKLVFQMVDSPAFVKDANESVGEALCRAIMKAYAVMYNEELEEEEEN